MRRALLALTLLLAAVSFSACGGDLYAGMPDHVKKRHLALEGAPNFRDLGGYATSDGQHLKWGQLYRSDNLAHLTDADLAKVSGLGIQLVHALAQVAGVPGAHGGDPRHELRIPLHVADQAEQLFWRVGQQPGDVVVQPS